MRRPREATTYHQEGTTMPFPDGHRWSQKMNEREEITYDQVPRFYYRFQNDVGEREQMERDAAAIHFDGQTSLTQQQFTEDADINIMMRRFGVTDGSIPPQVLDPSYFGDFSDAPTSLRDAHDRLRTAQLHFDQLPANIKNRFSNDYRELWSFMQDPNNIEEAIELKLLKRREPAQETASPPETPPNDTK